MARSIVGPLHDVKDTLAQGFQLTHEQEILGFLERHPTAASVLIEIRHAIRNYFGDDPVRLEVFHDPEWDSEWEAEDPDLFANIRTRVEPHDALTRLHRFDNEW